MLVGAPHSLRGRARTFNWLKTTLQRDIGRARRRENWAVCNSNESWKHIHYWAYVIIALVSDLMSNSDSSSAVCCLPSDALIRLTDWLSENLPAVNEFINWGNYKRSPQWAYISILVTSPTRANARTRIIHIRQSENSIGTRSAGLPSDVYV